MIFFATDSSHLFTIQSVSIDSIRICAPPHPNALPICVTTSHFLQCTSKPIRVALLVLSSYFHLSWQINVEAASPHISQRFFAAAIALGRIIFNHAAFPLSIWKTLRPHKSRGTSSGTRRYRFFEAVSFTLFRESTVFLGVPCPASRGLCSYCLEPLIFLAFEIFRQAPRHIHKLRRHNQHRRAVVVRAHFGHHLHAPQLQRCRIAHHQLRRLGQLL
jgi:hypothetical protein